MGGERTMAVKIRLRRMGAKKAPFYRVVVADSRYPRNGRFIEEVGTYNPLTDPATVNIDAEAVKKWISNGAQPTDTVKALLKKSNIMEDRLMKEVLEIIAKSLVDYPEQVDVKEINNEDQTVTLELRVAESDMGKVIGKQGRIAKAIRTVVKAAASRENKKVAVEILQ